MRSSSAQMATSTTSATTTVTTAETTRRATSERPGPSPESCGWDVAGSALSVVLIRSRRVSRIRWSMASRTWRSTRR